MRRVFTLPLRRAAMHRTRFALNIRGFSNDSKVVDAEIVDEKVGDEDHKVEEFDMPADFDPAQMMENLGDLGDHDAESTFIDHNKKGRSTEAPPSSERLAGAAHQHQFQAETRKILNIMANSLYTDKEVFLRELISNASDALEKARYLSTQDNELLDSTRPLELHIMTDAEKGTLTIQDFGVGMTKEDLINNLGTIARSGSKEFVQSLQQGGENIIGQFGVGFYSLFMVADLVEVYSQPCVTQDGKAQQGWYWKSEGDGNFEIAPAEDTVRGTKIIAHLKDDAKQYSVRLTLEGIIKKYSNFVGFPIFVDGEEVNTVDAVWAMDKDSVTDEQHTEFYRYISNAFDTPPMRLHFQTDVPIAINALFYMPERHMEKFGMGRLEPGVGLYSRKVLIMPKCKNILPDWLRFVKGVVDSEDLPLNISRENMQDSGLITRMNNILTKKIIRFLDTESRKDTAMYNTWFDEFGHFIKEGVCTDFTHKDDAAKLLRFDSSVELDADSKSTYTSLDDYIARMPVEQMHIYYLSAPNRAFAESSPYYEHFAEKGTEVLFLYQPIDDFTMKSLGTYQKRKLVSIESTESHEKKGDEATEDPQEMLDYVQETLSDRVSAVTASTRLVSSPAIVVDHESAAVRRMMKEVNTGGVNVDLPKQKLEINPTHPILKNAFMLKDSNPHLSKLVLQQVYDNALIAADILDNPRTMLNRINEILASVSNGPTDEAH
jgi:HSP90 family molecular chaperone